MPFVLITTTSGDDLMRARDILVAISDDKSKLEKLKDTRATERQQYLETHEIPAWRGGDIFSHERIEEVPLI